MVLARATRKMIAWLDENCGADGWAMTPSGTRGVLNDAVSIYFLDPTFAGAFVRMDNYATVPRSAPPQLAISHQPNRHPPHFFEEVSSLLSRAVGWSIAPEP